MEVDVAIIGAGPAGSLAATLLARRGVSVVLLDRDSFPRDKVCGEFLSYDGVAVLQACSASELLEDDGASLINRSRIFARRRVLEFDLPHPARGLSRRALDHALVQQARAAGVTVMENAAVQSIDAIAKRISLQHSAESLTVSSKLIIGAWGRWGRLDRQLERPFVEDHRTRHFGFQRHDAGGAPEGSVDLYSFDRGYVGVQAVEAGQMNVSGLAHETRIAGMKGRWEGFSATLAEENAPLGAVLDRDDALGPYLSSDPVIFSARAPEVNGVLMIGDAGAMIDPLTGNGMSMALQSALLVAPFAIRALAGEDVGAAYAAAHRDFFARRLRWSRMAARLLCRPDLLSRLIAIPGASLIAERFVRSTRASLDTVGRLAEVWFSQRRQA